MRYFEVLYLTAMMTLAFLSTVGMNNANHMRNHYEIETEYKLCTSPICEETGNEIIKSINQSIDPCDNFYKHACGGWIADHPVPDGELFTSQFEVVEMKLQAQLKEILLSNEPTDSDTVHKLRNFYRSCQDLAAIDSRGFISLDLIVLANGGWPLAIPSNYWRLKDQGLTLQKIHENYAKVAGRSALFVIGVRPDRLNSEMNLLTLKPPITPKNRQHTFKMQRNRRDILSLPYLIYAESVAKEFAKLQGFNVSSDNIEVDIAKIFQFEYSINEIYSSVPKDDFVDERFFGLTTIAQIQNTWSEAVSGHPDYAINWLETIRSAFDGTDIVISSRERIAIPRDKFLQKLANLLIKYPLRSVVNYVHWHAIDALVLHTNKKMRDISNVMLQNRYGYVNDDDQRSTFCINHHNMHEGLTYVWSQKHFSHNVSVTAIDMVSQIQAEMERQFVESTWTENEDKFWLKEKVNNMVRFIGYPSWYDESGELDEYYSKLAVGFDYFDNVVNYNRFKTMISLKKLRMPNDRYEMAQAQLSIQVNAYYSKELNSIIYPAVMFQTPFFHAERPLVFNYGSIGAAIGHEIAHAFTNGGIIYDEIGKKTEWLSQSMIITYVERAMCFRDQYTTYTLFKDKLGEIIYIDGLYTLEENIADNIGFTIALKAYLSLKKKHNLEDIRIPVLRNYMDEKLFFYSLSNFYCASERPEAVKFLWNDDNHSPPEVRVNGALSNMRAFAEAFDCPSGSPMNPVEKCVLWD